MWYALVTLFSIPGQCDLIWYGRFDTEALMRLEEVLERLSNFGLQLKAKECTFMQMEVAFLGHIVGRTGLACYPVCGLGM